MEALDLGFKAFVFYLLIFVRIAGVFIQAPLFGKPKGVPMQAQIGYSLAISLVMYHVLPMPEPMPENILGAMIAAVEQLIIGLAIGFAAYMVSAGLQFGGELMDSQLGLSIAATFDPSASGTVNLIRQFYMRLAVIVWIFIHGDYFLLKAIRRSFELIPATTFSMSNLAVVKMVDMTNGIFTMGLEIAAPVLITMFIVDTTMGLLNRAAAQFNVFMLSGPVKILGGFFVMMVSLGPIIYKVVPEFYLRMDRDIMELILAMSHK